MIRIQMPVLSIHHPSPISPNSLANAMRNPNPNAHTIHEIDEVEMNSI